VKYVYQHAITERVGDFLPPYAQPPLARLPPSRATDGATRLGHLVHIANMIPRILSSDVDVQGFSRMPRDPREYITTVSRLKSYPYCDGSQKKRSYMIIFIKLTQLICTTYTIITLI